jgi:Na+-driven multidrug efflux pump
MLQGSILQISSALRQAAVNGFDEYVVTGIATGEKLILFSWMIILSLESAFLYFAAQNTGAGKIDRVKSGWKFTFLVMLAVGAVFAFLFIFFGKYFYGLFVGYGDDAKTVAITGYANSYIISQMIFFPFMGLLASTRGAVKGMGRTFATIMCGALELFAVTVAVLAANFLPLSDSMRLGVIYLSLPFSWILTSISILILLIRTFNEKKKEMAISALQDTEIESVPK